MPQGQTWTGDWSDLHLQQSGDRVTGTFKFWDDTATLEGTAHGDVVAFSLVSGEYKGNGELKMLPSGQEVFGRYRTNKMAVDVQSHFVRTPPPNQPRPDSPEPSLTRLPYKNAVAVDFLPLIFDVGPAPALSVSLYYARLLDPHFRVYAGPVLCFLKGGEGVGIFGGAKYLPFDEVPAYLNLGAIHMITKSTDVFGYNNTSWGIVPGIGVAFSTGGGLIEPEIGVVYQTHGLFQPIYLRLNWGMFF